VNSEKKSGLEWEMYRLLGTDVLSYRFIVPYNDSVFVGDIFKIMDNNQNYTFFAKVTGIKHGSSFLNLEKDREISGIPTFSAKESWQSVEAYPLGFFDSSGNFNLPRTLPARCSKVVRPTQEDLMFLRKVMGGIEIGTMISGSGVIKDLTVALPERVLVQHMGVFATTGMGKSNFMKVFCASAMKSRKFGLLIVDPHGEYIGGLRGISGEIMQGLYHYEKGRDGLDIFSIRPQRDREQYGMKELFIEYDDFRMTDLGLLYELSGYILDIVESLDTFKGSDIIDFFMNEGMDSLPSASKTTSGVSFHPAIADIIRGSNPGAGRVIEGRVKNLQRTSSRFFRKNGSSITDILKSLYQNKVVLIDIPGLDERSELFLLSAIVRKILYFHEEAANQMGADLWTVEPKQVLITIEEAQRVLGPKAPDTGIFRECAMEGRKFGVGLCVITQQPKNIDQRILAQINTFVVMGLSDKKDRDTIAESAKQDLHHLDTEIQTLGRGDAIISTIGIPFPISTRIHLFENYLKELNKKG